MSNSKAIVVFSGGQDSTTCLYWAMDKFDEVEAVSFNYNQRHKLELECAKEIAEEAGVKHTILDLHLLNQLAPNALTRDDIEVAEGENGSLPSTFVDGRNHLFLSFVAVLAKNVGAKHIVTGVCETDSSGYPDCRDSFIKSLNVTLNLAMDYDFVIHTPLMWLNKEETWELADQLGAFYIVRDHTLTCYNGIKGAGCGECPACKLRAKGLEDYTNRVGKRTFGYKVGQQGFLLESADEEKATYRKATIIEVEQSMQDLKKVPDMDLILNSVQQQRIDLPHATLQDDTNGEISILPLQELSKYFVNSQNFLSRK